MQSRRRAEEETEKNFSMTHLAGRSFWIFFGDLFGEYRIFGEYFEGFWRKADFFVEVYFLDTLDIPGVLTTRVC